MNNPSSATHKVLQRSTTLNRRYVKRPVVAKSVASSSSPASSSSKNTIQSVAKRQAEDLKRRQALAEKMNRERLVSMRNSEMAKHGQVKPMAAAEPKSTPSKSMSIKSTSAQPTAKELKDRAIKQALRSVATMESEEKTPIKVKPVFGAKKVILAFVCAAVAVFGIGYLVNVNIPDISVRVTAMQSGIEDPYPSYVPRGYSFSSSVADEDKISIEFKNAEGQGFTLSEEKSSWDSAALLNNYVERNWTDYQPIREQGLTIYVSGSNATWVNGGIKYEITATSNNLTKKQIKAIVTSL